MSYSVADKLGTIKASIATLKREESALLAEVIGIAAGHPGTACALDGEVFRACVSWVDQTVTDHRAVLAAIVEEFDVPTERLEALLRRHTKTAPLVPRVRVSARKVTA